MGEDEALDLGIFDEAHKTAGRVGVRFAFAVADQNLLIRKRLFLTATPRHYDYRKKDKEGDAKLVYSMDVPDSLRADSRQTDVRRSRMHTDHLPLQGADLRRDFCHGQQRTSATRRSHYRR